MNTVVFKWNPSFSSYSMRRYLYDVSLMNEKRYVHFDWSVWDHDKIRKGDRFYWLKLGLGQVGIVGRGTICSDPFEGEDWSGKGRQTFYVEFKPETLICPEVFPLLSSDQLEQAIPDFDWRGGHSGLVLTVEQAEKLDALWDEFYNANIENWKEVRKKRYFWDTVYLAPKSRAKKQ